MDPSRLANHLRAILGAGVEEHPRATSAIMRFVHEAPVDMEDWLTWMASLKFTPSEWIWLYDKSKCEIAVMHLMLANYRANIITKELLLGQQRFVRPTE